MKKLSNFVIRVVVIIVLLAVAFSCEKDDDKKGDNPDSAEAKIITFFFSNINPAVEGIVNDEDKTISAAVPFGTDVTTLRATTTCTEGASVTPGQGEPLDYTNPVIFTVTANDGSTVTYTVTVTIGTGTNSSEKKILTFNFNAVSPSVAATIDENAKTVSFGLPPAVDPSSLVPSIAVSANATVTPGNGVAQNYSSPVTYTVTAQDGSTAGYTTIMESPAPSAKDVPLAPKHLCIYYGWPSTINGSGGNIAAAVNIFKDFDIIVFGDGLSSASHGDHNKTITIINDLKTLRPDIKIYGYIDIGVTTQNLSLAAIQSRVDAWELMGITGIFGDDFGYDYQVTRARQNNVIDYVHGKDLSFFANSWNIEDALGGGDCHLDAVHNDYYLLESFLVRLGDYTPLSGEENSFKVKGDKAYYYMKTKGVGIATVIKMPASALNASSATTDKFKLGWFGTALYNFDAYQFTNINFSSDNSTTYFYADPLSSYGEEWIDKDWVRKVSEDRYERSTNTTTLYIQGNGSSTGTGGN